MSQAAAGTATYALSTATDPPFPAGVGWANDEEVDCGWHRGRLGVVPTGHGIQLHVVLLRQYLHHKLLLTCAGLTGPPPRAAFFFQSEEQQNE